MIHALSQKTPVVCASSGGTKEVIGEFGSVLQEKIEITNPLFDYDNPTEIDVTQFNVELVAPTKEKPMLLPKFILSPELAPDVSMKRVVEKYLEVFAALQK